MHLRRFPSLLKTKHQMRHSCMTLKVLNAPCVVYFLLKRGRCFVHCQAKFVVWSVGSHSFLRIVWVYSTCVRNGQHWVHRHAAQIPRFAKSLRVCNYTQSG
jgi:hypothetical protein